MAVEDKEHDAAATQSGWDTPDPPYARLPHAVTRGPTASASAGS